MCCQTVTSFGESFWQYFMGLSQYFTELNSYLNISFKEFKKKVTK